jgi:hypothetical protein
MSAKTPDPDPNFPQSDDLREDIMQAIREADAGLFASSDEVETMRRRWALKQ